jgi:hypothetical protein
MSSTAKPNSGSTCPRKSRTSMRNDEAMSQSIACTSCKVVNDGAAFCALPVRFPTFKNWKRNRLKSCLKPIFCVRGYHQEGGHLRSGARGACRCQGERGSPAIKALRASGVESLRAIAASSNDQGIPTARGKGDWSSTQVAPVLEWID